MDNLLPRTAKLYLDLHEWDAALEFYHRLARRHPDALDVREAIARCFVETGQDDAALDAYRAIQSMVEIQGPGWWRAEYHIAGLLYRKGSYADTIVLIERDLALTPDLGGATLKQKLIDLLIRARARTE